MSTGLTLCLLLLSLFVASRATAEQGVARFAIVVGNNLPEASETPALRYADDDAVATHRLLREAGVESALLVHLDGDSRRLYPGLTPHASPRLSNFERVYTAIFARIRALRARGVSSELLVFYSGHGEVDGGEGYVVLEDGRLTRSALYTLLSRSPATRNHVFIDACKSYFLAFEKGPGGQRESYTKAFETVASPAALPSTGFVLSTSSDRDSHEWERFQAGILSHELRSALRGAADADGDGRVTYLELGAFLAAANRGIANPRFRPDFMVRPPRDDLHSEVLRWKRDPRVVRVEGSGVGHLYIETAGGERLLDVHPDATTPLQLHLPQERPLYARGNDESREYVIATQDPVEIATLAPATPEVARRGALHVAFAQLFAAPFGPADVVAFERAQQDQRRARSDTGGREPHRRARMRLAAGVLALGGAASGLALTTTALVKYERGSSVSQVELAKLNRDVRRLNIASIGCYALAAVAGATWAWLFAVRRRSVALAPVTQLDARQRSFGLSVSSVF